MSTTAAVIIVTDEPGDQVGIEVLWARKTDAQKATLAERFAHALVEAGRTQSKKPTDSTEADRNVRAPRKH